MKTIEAKTSLPSRQPLAQGIALALAFSAGTTQAAVFNVTTSDDSGPGSLRQAVLDANTSGGSDQITFDDGLGTINLTSGQIDITETLTITGPATGQTIDAGGTSRILAVTVNDQPLTLENLTLTGGHTAANAISPPYTCARFSSIGGGVCVLGDITLIDSTVTDNSTAGAGAHGGGVFVYGNAILTNSTVSGNSTTGSITKGGGIYVRDGDVTLTNSTVSGNSTVGMAGEGGGLCLLFGNATLSNSIVSSNSTAGDGSDGGGLYVRGNATLIDSTVSGNSTDGSFADGGGLAGVEGNVTLTNSTISGNSTANSVGGGLHVLNGDTILSNSTVTFNLSAAGAGGIEISNSSFYGAYTLTLVSTILAANSGPDGNFNPWIEFGGSITTNVTNSLFGDEPAEINGIESDNVFTDTPGLAPLANNGCAVPAGAPSSPACVQTHAVLSGSQALDAGSNPLDLATDERGAGFPRVIGTAADIGAFESRGTPATPTQTAIPALAPWSLALLSGLLGLIGWRFTGRLGRRRE